MIFGLNSGWEGISAFKIKTQNNACEDLSTTIKLNIQCFRVKSVQEVLTVFHFNSFVLTHIPCSVTLRIKRLEFPLGSIAPKSSRIFPDFIMRKIYYKVV